MTILQAVALRMKWHMLPYSSACAHRNLESEWDELGSSTGKYVCMVCGNSVVLQSKQPLLKRKQSRFHQMGTFYKPEGQGNIFRLH